MGIFLNVNVPSGPRRAARKASQFASSWSGYSVLRKSCDGRLSFRSIEALSTNSALSMIDSTSRQRASSCGFSALSGALRAYSSRSKPSSEHAFAPHVAAIKVHQVLHVQLYLFPVKAPITIEDCGAELSPGFHCVLACRQESFLLPCTARCHTACVPAHGDRSGPGRPRKASHFIACSKKIFDIGLEIFRHPEPLGRGPREFPIGPAGILLRVPSQVETFFSFEVAHELRSLAFVLDGPFYIVRLIIRWPR